MKLNMIRRKKKGDKWSEDLQALFSFCSFLIFTVFTIENNQGHCRYPIHHRIDEMRRKREKKPNIYRILFFALKFFVFLLRIAILFSYRIFLSFLTLALFHDDACGNFGISYYNMITKKGSKTQTIVIIVEFYLYLSKISSCNVRILSEKYERKKKPK